MVCRDGGEAGTRDDKKLERTTPSNKSSALCEGKALLIKGARHFT